jgi:hypothetical protein
MIEVGRCAAGACKTFRVKLPMEADVRLIVGGLSLGNAWKINTQTRDFYPHAERFRDLCETFLNNVPGLVLKLALIRRGFSISFTFRMSLAYFTGRQYLLPPEELKRSVVFISKDQSRKRFGKRLQSSY